MGDHFSFFHPLSQEGVVRWLLSPLPISVGIGGIGVATYQEEVAHRRSGKLRRKDRAAEAADMRTVRSFFVPQGVMPR